MSLSMILDPNKSAKKIPSQYHGNINFGASNVINSSLKKRNNGDKKKY